MECIRSLWSRSGWYRLGLILALIFLLIRTGGQVYYIFVASPEEMGSFRGVFVPNDLKDYLEAAERLSLRQDLYLQGVLDKVEFYQYAPAYALSVQPLLLIHPTLVVIFDTLLHAAAYVALYFSWRWIFRRVGLVKGELALAWTLPLWLVFEPFWSDLAYLNIYIFVALLATWLLDAILKENLLWALLWASLLLQTKPFWAFALGVPFILGNRKFFWKLLAGVVAGYLFIIGITILALGPEYGLQQYGDYYRFLAEMSGNFPWREPFTGMLGYNHSVVQIVIYLFGRSTASMLAAKAAKYVLLLPLVVRAVMDILRPSHPIDNLKRLDWAFALYVGAFIYLDIIWEVSLGLPVFAYLLAVSENRVERRLAFFIFIPYCLLDVWRFLSYLIWGMDVFAGAYILTDPSAYLPMILFVLLVFYILLLLRLFARRDVQRGVFEKQAQSPL